MPKMTFVSPDGTVRKEVDAPVGLSVLEIAHRNDIDLEGACEGSLACSTCHVVVEPKWYDELDDPTEEEEDMLDLAFGLTHTSRLGCQIKMTEDLDGLVVTLPSATRNMMVDREGEGFPVGWEKPGASGGTRPSPPPSPTCAFRAREREPRRTGAPLRPSPARSAGEGGTRASGRVRAFVMAPRFRPGPATASRN